MRCTTFPHPCGSQETLAELCGFSRSYIANIESGKHNVSLDNLERIAQAFEVPIAELLNPDFNLRIEQPQAVYFSILPLVDFGP